MSIDGSNSLRRAVKNRPDQMLGNATENALADAGDKAADLAAALIGEARGGLAVGGQFKARSAVTMTERSGSGHLDVADVRGALSNRLISPSNEPDTAATRNCISSL